MLVHAHLRKHVIVVCMVWPALGARADTAALE